MALCPNNHENVPGAAWCATCGAQMPGAEGAPVPPPYAGQAPPAAPPPYEPPAGPPAGSPAAAPPPPAVPPAAPPAAAPAGPPTAPAASAPAAAPAAASAAAHHTHAKPSSTRPGRGPAVVGGVLGLLVLAAWLVADVVVGTSEEKSAETFYGAWRWLDAFADVAGEAGQDDQWVPLLIGAIIIGTYVELLMGSLAAITGWKKSWTTLVLAAVLPLITWFVVWPVLYVYVLFDGLDPTYGDAVEGVVEDAWFYAFLAPSCVLLLVAAGLAYAGRPSRARS